MTATQPLLAYLRTTTQATRRTTRVLTQAIRLLWEASPTHTLLSGVLYAVQGIVSPVKIWLMKVLIDRIAASIQGASLTGWHDWLWPAALLLVSKLVEMWAQSASQAVSELLENQVVLRTQYLIFKKTAELDMAFFENAAFYDRLVNARNEIWRLHNVPFLSLSIVQQILALIFTLSLLMQLQPFAIVILFFTAVPYALLKSYFQTQQFNLAVGRIPAQRMVDYLGYRLLGVREAVKEIRIFGLEPILLQRFVDFWQERIEEQARLSRREVRVTSILALLPAAGVVSVGAGRSRPSGGWHDHDRYVGPGVPGRRASSSRVQAALSTNRLPLRSHPLLDGALQASQPLVCIGSGGDREGFSCASRARSYQTGHRVPQRLLSLSGQRDLRAQECKLHAASG